MTTIIHQPNEPLPLVYPLIIYTGEKPYHVSTDFFDLFAEQNQLAKKSFLNPVQLIDVHRMDDDTIKQKQWFGLVEFAFKYQQLQDIEQYFDEIMPWIHKIELKEGSHFAKIVIRYIVNRVSKFDEEIFMHKAETYLSQELNGEAMTLAEQLRQKGRQEGRQEALQEGRQEGRVECSMNIAKKLLNRGFNINEIADVTDLPVETVHQFIEAVEH